MTPEKRAKLAAAGARARALFLTPIEKKAAKRCIHGKRLRAACMGSLSQQACKSDKCAADATQLRNGIIYDAYVKYMEVTAAPPFTNPLL